MTAKPVPTQGEGLNYQLPLKAQPKNKVQPKEMIQLAGRGCIEGLATQDSAGLHSVLDFVDDPNTRAWSMLRLNRLQALAGWRFLPWDSQVLGCPSGSVGGLWAEGCYAEQCHRLETVLNACIADAADHGVHFLSVRLPECAIAALHAVEAVGFRIIESFLTFGRKIDGEIPFKDTSDFHVRLAQPDEMETVAAIAYRAFQSFRLWVDPQIPESCARHSRREWVRNGFKGRAEAIYVAESKNRLRSESPKLVGFALLRSKAATEKIGEIELIAVDPAFHGKGIGKALVAEAIRHYQGKTSAIQVGTQAKNLQAIGLYTRMGFSVVRSELSFHRHSDGVLTTESTHSIEATDARHLAAEKDREP